jgi:hypothetical protein
MSFSTMRAIITPSSFKNGSRGRIVLHFIPTYCRNVTSIWGLMRRNVSHNKMHETCAQFADATVEFMCENCPATGPPPRD